jgi:hypothetical protein
MAPINFFQKFSNVQAVGLEKVVVATRPHGRSPRNFSRHDRDRDRRCAWDPELNARQ